MKYTTYRYVLILAVLQPYANLSAISMVYNFRIAQITKQAIFPKTKDRKHTCVALVFDQYRKKHTGVRQNFVGGLGSYIYDFKSYYFRTDFAVSHIHEETGHVTTFSGTETDDILCTFGKNFIISDRTKDTISFLLGIPTHRILRLQHTDFGYSQVGLGIQLDGSYEFDHTNALLYGARYIYFIPRKALDPSCESHTFTLGNIGDVLFAYKYASLTHGMELGYTARSRFGAHSRPHYDAIVEKTNYLRSNFYFVYKYKFKIGDVSNRLLFNISYGFDHKPKLYGNKYIITLWGSWNISF